MAPKCLSQNNFLKLIGIVAFLLVSCNAIDSITDFPDEQVDWPQKLFAGTYNSAIDNPGSDLAGNQQVDPLFADFYSAMGGVDIMGPVISPVKNVEGQTRQYLESGLMVFDPRSSESERFSLAPLGVDLGVNQGVILQSSGNRGRVINGHFVTADFLDFYEQLGGARFVGKPISDLMFITAKGRVEQYFENLGFYKHENENNIHLMPYGAFACDKNCRKNQPANSIVARQPILPEPFVKKTIELGLPFVGKPLTGLHYAPDGTQEVIFENLVLFAEEETTETVEVRPISSEFGSHADELALPIDSNLSTFFEIEGGLGHNVPNYFIEFLDLYGGFDVSGMPISEVYSPAEGIYWQCFANLCLEFDINKEGDGRLSPVPLGKEYKSINYDQVRDYSANQAFDDLNIQSWEKFTFVSSRDYQEIFVAFYENGKPLKNCEPVLIVTMPDGSQHKGFFQPSDENGQTSIKLAPIEAPSGTLIAYRICLSGKLDDSPCIGDNYLIWNSN